jgi:hypothetical protein
MISSRGDVDVDARSGGVGASEYSRHIFMENKAKVDVENASGARAELSALGLH